MSNPSTSTIYVEHTSRIHASRPASFGPHFSNPNGQQMNLIPIEFVYDRLQILSPSKLTQPSLDHHHHHQLRRRGCPPKPASNQLLINHIQDDHQHSHEIVKDWIALVERGTCAFIDKVRQAQSLGASAVIVGDWSESSSSTTSLSLSPFSRNPIFYQHPSTAQADNFGFNSGLLTMFAPGDTSDVLIPSVFVARDSYLSLIQDWKEFSSNLNHDLYQRQSLTHHHQIQSLKVIMSKDELWTWPFFDLVIILLFLPSILTVVTLLLHRINAFRKRRADRAPKELVNRLPSVIWAKDMEKGIPFFGDSHLSPSQGLKKSNSSRSSRWISKLSAQLQKIQPRLNVTTLFLNIPSEQTPLLSSSSNSHHSQPVLKKSQQKVSFSQRECALCLSDFEVGDLIRILPCGHCFHQCQLAEQCMGIDCWLLKSKRFCPVCRMSIIEEPSSSSDASAHPRIPDPVVPPLETTSAAGSVPEPIPATTDNSNQQVPGPSSARNVDEPIPSSSSVTLDHFYHSSSTRV